VVLIVTITNDLIERFRQHIEYSIKRDEFARRAIELLKQGKHKAGMAAARKAEYWDAKAKALLER
jgi:hypothetical protein